MSAAKDSTTDAITIVSTADAATYVQRTDPPVVVKVCPPFQVFYDEIVFTDGDTVQLPADVAARYVLAGWVEPTT